MTSRTIQQRALDAIEARGALLVFPIQNRPSPPSLWHVLHPGVAMRWDWDESADPRVPALWHLREMLARSREVVYSKWYRGRATFFSRTLFTAMLATQRTTDDRARGLEAGLPPDAIEMLRLLESDSPRSTKQLRRDAGLTGKMFEASFRSGLTELFRRMLIVGYGEVDDGSFPSLAVGATRVLFEELWDEASTLDPIAAAERVRALLPSGSPFARQHETYLRARERSVDRDRIDAAL
jgi:hypothetical protein